MQYMSVSDKGLAEIAGYEGLCVTKYLDSVGVQTIGIGSTSSDIPDLKSWAWDKKLSIPDVFATFKQHIVKYENALNKALKVDVEQHQYDALVSICYNIGTSGAANSTFMKRINAGAPIGRIMYFLGRPEDDVWTPEWRTDPNMQMEEDICLGFAGGGTIMDAILMWNQPKEIMGRRKKEAKLYSTGQYGDGKVLVFPVSSTHHPVYSKGYTINALEYI